jgi:hypothetical protein
MADAKVIFRERGAGGGVLQGMREHPRRRFF